MRARSPESQDQESQEPREPGPSESFLFLMAAAFTSTLAFLCLGHTGTQIVASLDFK